MEYLFSGRLGRRSFMLLGLGLTCLFFLAKSILDVNQWHLAQLGMDYWTIESAMGFLPSLGRFATIVVLFIASIVIVKRLHDLERPGVELFLLLIPIYNAFFALKLICKPGTPGANIFGPNPVEVKAGTAKSGFIRPTRSFRSRDLIERATYRTSFH